MIVGGWWQRGRVEFVSKGNTHAKGPWWNAKGGGEGCVSQGAASVLPRWVRSVFEMGRAARAKRTGRMPLSL